MLCYFDHWYVIEKFIVDHSSWTKVSYKLKLLIGLANTFKLALLEILIVLMYYIISTDIYMIHQTLYKTANLYIFFLSYKIIVIKKSIS